jgi:N-acetylglucosaminyldiphosphoundecaprenol N-acetyl-beta-D-mannosaminyltransferase
VLRRITAARPSVLWVGLGMPKQELWMHRVRDRLPGMTLMGVGAAFDMLAGRVSQAPQWMRDAGLEWMYRLAQEPRRLWRRYVLNNPAFMLLLLRELAVGARG